MQGLGEKEDYLKSLTAILGFVNLTLSYLLEINHMETTTLSSRGQVVIPKMLREARHWLPGTEFGVEDLPQGILLRPLRAFAPSRLEDILGCLKYEGPALSQGDIDAALQADAEAQYSLEIGLRNPAEK